MKSKIYLEKMEHIPGIYIIYNISSKKLYIGQATRLKERALQHIEYLYKGVDNNLTLQAEFINNPSKYYIGILKEGIKIDELDKWESTFYCAAVKLYGSENVYNKIKLEKELNSNEIEQAQDNIKEALERDIRNCDQYTETKSKDMKDWVPYDVVKELKLQKKSLVEMYKNHEIDFLLFGKAGDYIGDGSPQTISAILREKVSELNNISDNEKRRCLWASSGPHMDNSKKYFALYKKYKPNNKMYVLFKLTVNPYDKSKEKAVSFYWEKDGTKYFDTAPDRKTKKAKALVIKNFYIVQEDFDFKTLEKNYFKCDLKTIKNNKLIYNPREWRRSRYTLTPTILQEYLLSPENKELRREMEVLENEAAWEELKETEPQSKFPECDSANEMAYYILAEVEDYVEIKKV